MYWHGVSTHKRPDGTICGAALDPKGAHARSCTVGGWLVRRHDAVCAALAAWAEQQDCNVYREAILPNANPAAAQARMDLLIHAPGVAGPIYVDVTIVSAVSREALRSGSGSRSGVAAEIAARRKARAYPSISAIPFVIEDHGRFGKDAMRLLRMLAPTAPGLRTAAIREIYQTLGSTAQKVAADAIIAATTARAHGRGGRS